MERFRYTGKASGVPFTVVVSLTRKVNGVEGGAWYGVTVTFERIILRVWKSGTLLRGIACFCVRRACVDIAAARRIATEDTTSPFTANRRGFRSPSQYGTTNVLTGVRRMTRHGIELSASTCGSATMRPRMTRYVSRTHTVHPSFWN